MICKFTFHSSSFPTLEIRSGVTAVVDVLLGGDEIRSTNNSGSGKSALLFCDFWRRF